MSTKANEFTGTATNPRRDRGIQIAKTMKLSKAGDVWRVPSQTGNGRYTVRFDGAEPVCDCPDFEVRGVVCKHCYAVEYIRTMSYTERSGAEINITQKVRITYAQHWPTYNQSQQHEKELFLRLLSDLCDTIEEPSQERGRPRVPLRDATFSAAFKVFSRMSARRFMTDLCDAQGSGYIDETPSFNSVLAGFSRDEMTDTLQKLIALSSVPLRGVETDFAIDSSGFSSCRFVRWFDTKYGKSQAVHYWVKAHLMVGVRTHVVTAVEITALNGADAPELPDLVQRTAANFTIAEVSGDKAYLSLKNLSSIANVGAAPFIPMKINSRPNGKPLWDKLYHMFALRRDEFLASYHKRSNVETAFHMIKAKFGDSVRAKTERAMFNEVLLKILCHNICRVIAAMFERGIAPEFG